MGQFASTQPTFISIEGNIGSGKTTLLAHLQNKYKNDKNYVFLKEPVDEWCSIIDENGINILQNFYGNPEKYAFSFQILAYITRLNTYKQAVQDNPDAKYIITERCLETDRHVFAKMLFDSKKISCIDYKIYMNWFNVFAQDFPIAGIIYINTKPEICHERVNKRSRDGECSISIDYLKDCDTYTNNMITYMKPTLLEINGDIDADEKQFELWGHDVDLYIAKHFAKYKENNIVFYSYVFIILLCCAYQYYK